MIKSVIKKIYRYWRNRPVINFYKTDFSKKVLISYIPYPFRIKNSSSHTNYQESKVIADVFNDMGYRVDIYFQEDQRKIDYNAYDIIFGVGDPLEKSFYYQFKKQPLRIYYGLGRQIIVNNKASLVQIKNFYKKHQQLILNSARIGQKAWQIQTTLIDAIITLGNDVAKKSYQEFYDGSIYNLPVTYIKGFDYKKIVQEKDFDKAKKHYLWIGGAGLIHKGLNLLLDFFGSSENKDLHLHVCGPLKREKQFMDFYAGLIANHKNIHVYDFVDITSNQFKKILLKTAFVLSPTASEGQPSSIINAIANGALVPIMSKESAIDLDNDGILIKSLDESSIITAIKQSQKLSTKKIKEMSLKVAKRITLEHNIENYKKKMSNHLKQIMKDFYG